MKKAKYSDSVFINCPFDDAYANMFRACTFTILDSGFVPRSAFEFADGTQVRLTSIIALIKSCKYGVHDLSRVQLDDKNKLPRFNMPYELGLFHGAKHFGEVKHNRKACLILETQRYRYPKFISDIAGIDIKAHKDTQKELIFILRNWLFNQSERTTIPQGSTINTRFQKFQRHMRKLCRELDTNYKAMPFLEVLKEMEDWFEVNQIRNPN